VKKQSILSIDGGKCKNLENTGEILEKHRIWESLILPKDYRYERKLSSDPMIFFIIKGSVSLLVNSLEKHEVFSSEMFMIQSDNSYEMTVLEQTQVLICVIPIEAWYAEQKWIEELIPENENISNKFLKLPVKKVVLRFLLLMLTYVDEGIHSVSFCELKRRELFFLLVFYYKKSELAQFLQYILSKDIKFKKFVVANFQTAGNVKALAKLANYSTSGFIKKFQKCFNESPYKWMQKQKAKRISVEINRGGKSLQEIANEFNFSSYQHFSVFCKKKLGAPPTSIFEKLSY